MSEAGSKSGTGLWKYFLRKTWRFRAEVPDRYFSQIEAGSAVTVYLDSTPPAQLAGVISAVIPKADALSRVSRQDCSQGSSTLGSPG